MGKSYRFPKNPLCIYCQKRPGDTKDHSFARAFFGSVQPEFAMKVPACAQCNAGKGDGHDCDMSNDEEHVRTLFAMAAEKHPTAKRLLQKEISTSFTLAESLRNKFEAKKVTVDGITRSGIIVPNVPALRWNQDDRTKINRVITKMVKGLHYTMCEVTWPDPCPLPLDWRVVIRDLETKQLLELDKKFYQCPRNSIWTGMGSENAIRFRGVSEARDSHRTLWLLLFYDLLAFFAYTEPLSTDRS